MKEPMPENNPSDTRTQIAVVCAILKTRTNLNEQEKAEAVKLKAEIERLTNRPMTPNDLPSRKDKSKNGIGFERITSRNKKEIFG